ncbi:MAG: hypothetical protein Q4G08_05825 [Capnocytophaga sp.]|nr:hypothetical protein [Capnocytophaga sp.]
MKKIILFVGLMVSCAIASAQGSLEVGSAQLNAGLGVSGWGVPVYVGIDVGVHDDVTVGAEISYRNDTQRFGNGKIKYGGLGIGANGNYHFNNLFDLPTEFDVYAGASLVYMTWTRNISGGAYSGAFDHSSGLAMLIQTGGRYFFTNDFGVNVEAFGGSMFGAKAGITYKF